MKSKLTVLVSGMIAADPFQGGAVWAVLQYVLGLEALGHEVYVIEPMPQSALQPAGCMLADSQNARYFRTVAEAFNLQDRAALLLNGTDETDGLTLAQLKKLTARTDLHLNIAGMLTDERLTARIPVRVYLDLDPAFTQLWNAVQGIEMRFTGHTHHATIGLNIGRPGCPLPTCGLQWIKTLQPVFLSHWPVSPVIDRDALTTIGNWRGYGSIEHKGIHYGQKAHSLREFFALPQQTQEAFHLAMAIHPAEQKDLTALNQAGWHLIDPRQTTATPRDYQKFIQGSKAEFGIAKSGYTKSKCGWFSDRSLCYLASGKPVIAQATGFSEHLPTGHGLFAFETVPDVLAALEALRHDYPAHSAAARAIAEDCFDSHKVLAQLLHTLGC